MRIENAKVTNSRELSLAIRDKPGERLQWTKRKRNIMRWNTYRKSVNLKNCRGMMRDKLNLKLLLTRWQRDSIFSRVKLVKLFCRKSERKDMAINFSFDLTEAPRRHARFVSMITTKNWRGIKEKDEEQKARSKMAMMTIITEQRSCTVAEKFSRKAFQASLSLSLSLSLTVFLPAFPTSQQAASALKNNEAQGTKLLPDRGSGGTLKTDTSLQTPGCSENSCTVEAVACEKR